jgi:hypothetical protein
MLELAPVWVWLGSALKPTDPRPAGGTKLVRRLHPRLIDIASPPRDQVHVTVHDRLAGDLAAVHPDVEPLDGFVLGQDVEADLIEEEADRPLLWFIQVKNVGA